MDEIISANEAAKMLNIGGKTLRRYCGDGKLAYIQYSKRKNLYKKKDIINFIESRYKKEDEFLI